MFSQGLNSQMLAHSNPAKPFLKMSFSISEVRIRRFDVEVILKICFYLVRIRRCDRSTYRHRCRAKGTRRSCSNKRRPNCNRRSSGSRRPTGAIRCVAGPPSRPARYIIDIIKMFYNSVRSFGKTGEINLSALFEGTVVYCTSSKLELYYPT